MVETFCFTAGRYDFQQGLKEENMMISSYSATKFDCHAAEPLICHCCSTCLYFSITPGNSVCLSSPHFLCPESVRGKIHADGNLAFSGFQLLINKLSCSLCQRNQIQLWTLSKRWKRLERVLVCPCSGRQQIAAHPAP